MQPKFIFLTQPKPLKGHNIFLPVVLKTSNGKVATLEMIFLMMYRMFKFILVVKNQITSLFLNNFLTIIPSSQLQMENVNSISIFTIQDHSNGILGPQFEPHLLLTCFVSRI